MVRREVGRIQNSFQDGDFLVRQRVLAREVCRRTDDGLLIKKLLVESLMVAEVLLSDPFMLIERYGSYMLIYR